MIKILFVIGQLSVGGSELQLLQLAGGLNKEKFAVKVVCLSETYTSLVSKFISHNIPTVTLNRESQGRAVTALKLTWIIKSFKPDVVHAFAYASRVAIPISKIVFGTKGIVSIRTQPGWQVTGLDKLANSFADYVLTNSQRADQTIKFGFTKSIPHTVIHNGIDMKKFDFDSAAVFPLAVSWGSADRIICSISNLRPVKGLDNLLDAFAIIVNRMSNVQLWIVGDGQEKEKLQERARQLGIGSKVFFCGQQSNIPAILRRAHVGVLSSRVEGLPNAVIEYMAARLPVVATNVGGIPEVVIHDVNGLLVEPDCPSTLADAVLKLLQNSDLAEQLGRNGRLFVEKRFDLGRMIGETEKIYETVCEETPDTILV